MRLLVLVSLFLISNTIFGCSCVTIGNHSDTAQAKSGLKNADYVIRGTVINSETVYLYPYEDDKQLDSISRFRFKVTKRIITLKVSSYFKTKHKLKTDTIYIQTGVGGGDCGYRFKIGSEYVVYGSAVKEDPKKEVLVQMETNICTRTTNNINREVDLLSLFRKEKFLKP